MSAILLDRFGTDSIFSIIMDKHLCWLGYVGETRLSKIMQFGEMKKKDLHMGQESVGEILFLMMDSMNCVRIGTVGIRDVRRGSSNSPLILQRMYCCREGIKPGTERNQLGCAGFNLLCSTCCS